MALKFFGLIVFALATILPSGQASAQDSGGRILDRCEETGLCFRVLCGSNDRNCEVIGTGDRFEGRGFWSRDEFRERLRESEWRAFFGRGEDDR